MGCLWWSLAWAVAPAAHPNTPEGKAVLGQARKNPQKVGATNMEPQIHGVLLYSHGTFFTNAKCMASHTVEEHGQWHISVKLKILKIGNTVQGLYFIHT